MGNILQLAILKMHLLQYLVLGTITAFILAVIMVVIILLDPPLCGQAGLELHDLWKERYPYSPEKHGILWVGIADAFSGLKAHTNPNLDRNQLPFDSLEYIEHLDQLPFDPDMAPVHGQ